MPYSTEYVEPEVFCEIDGVSIYYLYRNDDVEPAPLISVYLPVEVVLAE
jgi:hypothetical protein